MYDDESRIPSDLVSRVREAKDILATRLRRMERLTRLATRAAIVATAAIVYLLRG